MTTVTRIKLPLRVVYKTAVVPALNTVGHHVRLKVVTVVFAVCYPGPTGTSWRDRAAELLGLGGALRHRRLIKHRVGHMGARHFLLL